jgi:hypothetical protein
LFARLVHGGRQFGRVHYCELRSSLTLLCY